MTRKTRALDLVFTLIVGVLYAYALSSACLAGTYLEYPERPLFLWCALFTILLLGVFFNRYTTATFLIALLLTTLGVYIYLYRTGFEAAWFQALSAYIGELLDFAVSSLQLQEGYSAVLARGIAFVYALLTVVFLHATFRPLVLAVLGLGTIVYPIYMDWGVSRIAIVLFIFCMVVVLSKKLNLSASAFRWRERRMNAGYSLAMLPLCALILAVAWLLPKPAQAPGGSGVQDFFFRSTNRFVASITGDTIMSYTEDSEPLGGPVTLTNLLVMDVYTDHRVYLTGIVRDVYTGTSWTRSSASTLPLGDADGLLDSDPYASWESEQQYAVFYAVGSGTVFGELEVVMGDFETSTIFTPPFAQRLAPLEGMDDLEARMDEFGALSADAYLPGGSRYNHIFLAWDWDDEYLQEYLRWSDPALVANEPSFRRYLELPDSLPERVRELTAQVTANAGTPYEQMLAVQDYLRGMPYTLMPSPVPGDADFVDHFLFEEQQGYCVYFATAFAVMGRCLDIPTRYVEGFALSERNYTDDHYVVTNAQAHAWAEAYFPGIGWVPFEPTPPGFTSGELVSSEDDETDDGQMPELLPSNPEESSRDEESSREEEASRPDQDDSQSQSPDDPDQPATPARRVGPGFVVFCMVLVALLGVGTRIFLVHRRFERQRQNPRTGRDGVLSYSTGIARMAHMLGVQAEPGETVLAAAERLAGSPPFTGRLTNVRQVADIFCKSAFSEETVTDEELEVVARFHADLLATTTRTLPGRLRYLLRHYLVGDL